MTEGRPTRTNGLLVAAGASAFGALLLVLFGPDATEVRIGAGVLAVTAAGLVVLFLVRRPHGGVR